ncbi:MAG: transcriptional repressor LexA [Bacteriovoracaceae bacterium]|nr:transcriptional repressor LexA [Bacteriovoracaceae bacterium]
MLTKKQKQVYDFILQYHAELGYSPTQKEIQEHFGFKSLGSVQDYIKYLANAGYLKNDPNGVRGLEPLWEVGFKQSALEKSIIPLLGSIAAGAPLEVLENPSDIEVPSHFLGRGEHYALSVKGNSMIEDGILDGDTVIIKKQNSALNGETVVAILQEAATLKRFYKKENRIELHPANKQMLPLIVENKEAGCFEIRGILVGLLRQY